MGRYLPDEYWNAGYSLVGSTHAVSEEHPKGRLVGHLIIPDVDERRGWREWYVYRDAGAPDRTLVGFRRPGEEKE